MKLFSSYLKEMKIAARGFYFYIEIFVAVILLIILLFGVKESLTSKQKEFLYNDLPAEIYSELYRQNAEQGRIKLVDETEWELEPIEFTLKNRETGEETFYSFEDEKIISLKTVQKIDPVSGRLKVTSYEVPGYEDMLRLSFQEKSIGAVTAIDKNGRFGFKYILQGYETDRLRDALYILHNDDFDILEDQIEKQIFRDLGSTERLNNRENIVPVFLAFAGSLMGFFIVVSYIFLDKSEGVIKAFAVTPASIYSYLISKVMVICTTVALSSSIIVIPVMGAGPNYPLLYLFIIITTFAFAALGLLVAGYFDNMTKSFGLLYGLMIVLMIPAFSYYIPSFDPLWLRFFPTYPLLQVYKDLLSGSGDLSYAAVTTAAFLAGGALLLVLANRRFRKTLTV